jgi:hypothetical protein
MPAHPPITRQSFGRTFTVAGATLGLIAVLQVGAVAVRFFQQPLGGTGAETSSMPPSKIDIANIDPGGQPGEEPLIVGKDPLETEPVVMNEQGLRPVPVRPEPVVAVPIPKPPGPTPEGPVQATPFANGRPTPVPIEQLTPKVAPQYTELIEQGKMWRKSGDTAGALKKFGEAANLEPGNALALAELAYTFEKMSLPDKAAEQWRRVLNLGENGGALYSAARAKLEMAIGSVVRPTASSVASSVIIPDGHVMGLGKPTITPEPAGNSIRKFTFQVPVVARRGVAVARGDVRVEVLFYEQLNGKDVSNNSAHVKSRWASPPADWTEDQTEILEIDYDLRANGERNERRDYYGYIARLYYQGELQATYAEPTALNQKYPAPKTISDPR